ncbi:uncharacterized protein LOC144705940 isoform X2 [Wolffia australiana]
MHRSQTWLKKTDGEENERNAQQRVWYRQRRAQMSLEEIADQNQRRRMRYRQKRLKASAAEQRENSRSSREEVSREFWVEGNGYGRCHWRWKVEARRGKGENAIADTAAISGDCARSDDSESTETDESCFASFSTINRSANDDHAVCSREVTSEIGSVGDVCQHRSTAKGIVRLSHVKQQARRLCINPVSHFMCVIRGLD